MGFNKRTYLKKSLHIFLLISYIYTYPAYAGESAKVRILWEYTDIQAAMKIYEPKQPYPPVWETKTVSNFNQIPITTEIKNAAFEIEKDTIKRFVIVMENNSKNTVHFFVTPHTAIPLKSIMAVDFTCLCQHQHHIYDIPPGEIWYRVVEIRINKLFPSDNIDITHKIIGLSDREMPPMN